MNWSLKNWNISFEFTLIRRCLYIYKIKCTGPTYRDIYVTIIKCKHWMCRKVRMVKATVFFIFEELLGALIHMESRYYLKWTLFFICCSLFNFIMWWFYLISLCGSFDAAHWDFLSVLLLSFINKWDILKVKGAEATCVETASEMKKCFRLKDMLNFNVLWNV